MKTIRTHSKAQPPSAVRQLIGGIVLGLTLVGTATAGQLIYTPVNPSFGGNPFNGPYLMSIAQQQASEKAPNPLGDAFTDLTGTLDNICTAVSCNDPAASADAGATDGASGASAPLNATSTGPINSGVIE